MDSKIEEILNQILVRLSEIEKRLGINTTKQSEKFDDLTCPECGGFNCQCRKPI